MEELLVELEGWVKGVASRYTKDPGLADDLAQEGLVAAWRAAQRSGSTSLSYCKKAAVWRINSCWKTNQWLTTYRRTQNSSEPPVPIPANHPAVANLSVTDPEIDEIPAAVLALPDYQRQYVILRFWGGYTGAELDTMYGYGTSSIWTRAKATLKETLREEISADAGA